MKAELIKTSLGIRLQITAETIAEGLALENMFPIVANKANKLAPFDEPNNLRPREPILLDARILTTDIMDEF